MLTELTEHFETLVTLPTGTSALDLRLHWRNGEILAATRGHGSDISGDDVKLYRRSLPETLITTLPGRPMHCVFDEPFKCASPITRVENKDGNVVLAVAPDRWLVNLRSGRMWPNASYQPPQHRL